jgi:uncharacterized protein YbjT (DUF2867 family)
MKILIPGGTGQVGRILCRAFASGDDEVVVLSRKANPRITFGDSLINTEASARCFYTTDKQKPFKRFVERVGAGPPR